MDIYVYVWVGPTAVAHVVLIMCWQRNKTKTNCMCALLNSFISACNVIHCTNTSYLSSDYTIAYMLIELDNGILVLKCVFTLYII